MTAVKFEMNAQTAAILREPFAAEQIGKLPRVYCKACRDAQFKVCQQHTRRKCRDCGNNITDAHLHLDYVGHAEITDRLLHADPKWTWEPVAIGADGLPLRDQMGGLWIRLTVAGVTRLGYGHADGKTGPDAVKEAIGDALRNAAMRFGVALDLWGATFKDSADAEPEQPEPDPEQQRQNVLTGGRKAVSEAASLTVLGANWDRVRHYAGQGVLRPEDVEELRMLADARRAELEQAENRTAEPAEQPPACGDPHHRHNGPCEVYAPAEQPAMDADWPEPAKPGAQRDPS